MKLLETLKGQRLICYLGNGGVGKTTVSAATALALADSHKVLVLTVDPAKRLADSLGVSVGSSPTAISSVPNLYGLMVETKKCLDDMILQYGAQNKERILQNPFYHIFSESSGVEDFVSSGVLIELLKKPQGDPHYFDTIVVDTAPSAHGIEFLSASERVLNVFDSGLMNVLFSQNKWFGKMLQSGVMKKTFGLFNKWTSEQFVQDAARFIEDFGPLRSMLKTNALSLDDYLHSDKATLALVTSSDSEIQRETLQMYHDMQDGLGMPLSYVVVNRMETPVTVPSQFVHPKAREILEFHCTKAAQDGQSLAHLKALMPVPFYTIPRFEQSIYSLDGLRKIGSQLFSHE